MRWLASIIMRGRMQAIAVTAVSAVLSLLIPLLSLLSGAAVGLVTLRQGYRAGLQIIAASALAVAALELALGSTPLYGLALVFVLWLPVWVLAISQRRTASQGRSLGLALLFGAMLIVGLHLLTDDPAAWWLERLQSLTQAAAKADGLDVPGDTSVLGDIAALMTGVFGAMVSLNLFICLLLARWWQALLYNPGGFRDEFHALRLGRNIAVGAGVMALLAGFGSGMPQALAQDLMMLFSVAFAVQGLAVTHSLIRYRKASVGWLIGVYVLLLFPITMTQTVLTLALGGLVDNWFDFRQRFAKSG